MGFSGISGSGARRDDGSRRAHRNPHAQAPSGSEDPWLAFGLALSTHDDASSRLRDTTNESELRFRQVVDLLPDTFIACRQGVVAYLNTSGAMMIGFERGADATGVALTDLIDWPIGETWTPSNAVAADGDAVPERARIRRLDGSFVDVEVLGVNLEFQDEEMLLLIVRDITDRVRREEHVRRMAFHDALTGIPNRALFMDRLEHAVTSAHRTGQCFAVAFVDLDGFKQINDGLGHDAGDAVLRTVAERLHEGMREEDTIARQGGDEFTVIARLTAPDDADALAQRLLSAVADYIDVAGGRVRVGASVGVAVYPDDGTCAHELLSAADVAMYAAKSAGGSAYRVGVSGPRVRKEVGGAWRNVVEACTKGELAVRYRPLFDARIPGFCGIEALPYWGCDTTGLVPVSEIVPTPALRIMPDTVLEWLVATACASARGLVDEGYDFGRLSIRLDAQQFGVPDTAALIVRAINRARFDPTRLEIEVVNAVAVADMESACGAMSELGERGIRIATDCLSPRVRLGRCAARFPAQALRVGADFVAHVDSDSGAAALVEALVQLCEELHVDVVAEGVDTLSQMRFLRSRGCFVYQGDLVGGVVSLGALRSVLRTRAGLLSDLLGA